MANNTNDTPAITSNIRSCTCKNEYQDSLYGKGKRVFTVGIKAYSCTVCGNKHTIK